MNPLEITRLHHFSSPWGRRRLPITRRVECFECSCCPPDQTRLLPRLGEYIYGREGETLYGPAKGDCRREAALRLIPYGAFANRGESDMLVWLHKKV